MGLWLLEQIDKGGLEEEKRRAVSNSLGRLLLPLVDSLGSKLAELEQGQFLLTHWAVVWLIGFQPGSFAVRGGDGRAFV
jgi:hypothetical protein